MLERLHLKPQQQASVENAFSGTKCGLHTYYFKYRYSKVIVVLYRCLTDVCSPNAGQAPTVHRALAMPDGWPALCGLAFA